MYEARKRRPLRRYRTVRETDFFIDGDPDPVDIAFPSSDGFEQDVIRFDRRNGWNADIVAAAKELLPEVSDPSAMSALTKLIEDLPPQSPPAYRRQAIPPRHRAWKPVHDLATDVLNGLGLNYTQGQAHAPGYLVATWRVWEDLLTVASRLGFGRSAVVPQRGFSLGARFIASTGHKSTLSVYPDCVIERDGTRPRILLDAKYKGHVEKGPLRISEADVYESLAFAKASTCNQVVLAFPALPTSPPKPIGSCIVFEKIQVDAVQIVGIQIECRRISKSGALKEFASNVKQGISLAFA